MKWSSALGGATALCGTGVFYGLKAAERRKPEADDIIWTSCNVNCSSRCALRAHVKDGVITRIETDNAGDDAYGGHQIRACLRGRSMRHLVYAPDRLKYPMKRVGKRGEGKFERITWHEAINEIAARLRKAIREHGNESVYINYATGQVGSTLSKSWPPSGTVIARLMNCLGGFLDQYGTYSSAMIREAMMRTYGDGGIGSNGVNDMAYSKLAVFFGWNPGETAAGGSAFMHDLLTARAKSGLRIIIIDPCFTDTAVSVADEWIPIRPGTDAALCSALAYEIVTNNLADEDFMHRFTVGYDEAGMPRGVPGGNSYKSYILGHGRDRTPKTPKWAAEICGIPEHRITRLAHEIGTAKPCCIAQGWGPQRQANGEQSCRSIAAIACLTGNVGIHGGGTGALPDCSHMPFVRFPTLSNPVKASIPMFLWTDAIVRGPEMTAKRDGIRGADQLKSPIKFLWNYAGNCIVNQHSDCNKTQAILQDETRCETIVVMDNFMTSSARYADILLPCVSNLEEADLVCHDNTAAQQYAIFAGKVVDPMWECRSVYDICSDIAKRMGVWEQYSEGRTRDEWIHYLYAQARIILPDLPPTVEEAFGMGIYRRPAQGEPFVPFESFRKDPEKNPLKTPSGKIEIFSRYMWECGREWELAAGDRIPGVPEFLDTWEGARDPLRAEFPIQLIGHHSKQRTHSTYGNVDWLKRVAAHELWLNTEDAEARGIRHGDRAKVFNGRGEVEVRVKVTPRIMPGVATLPEGAWYTPDPDGTDHGGCINVLTSQRPSPFAKGNPQHTNLVQVVKV